MATWSALITLGPQLVGMVLVLAGFAKAIAPDRFERHLRRLGIIPGRLLPAAAVTGSVVEVFWGARLITRLYARLVLPWTLFLLIVLTAVTAWVVKSGRATDCGCYGGFVVPSLPQSIGLNLIYGLLVSSAWQFGSPQPTPTSLRLIEVTAPVLAAAVLAIISGTHSRRTGTPLFNLSPLKTGRRWNPRWAGNASTDKNADFLVSYLGLNCPFCHEWVRVLNVVHATPLLPRVVGVVSGPSEERAAFVAEHRIAFPMVAVSESLMNRLVFAVPTTILVNRGVIGERWTGTITPEFYARFRDAVFQRSLSMPLENKIV